MGIQNTEVASLLKRQLSLFKRSKYVMLFYLFVSITIGLCSAAISDSLEMTARLPNGLSDRSIALEIPVSEHVQTACVGQLVLMINQFEEQAFAIYKRNTVWWSGVYLQNWNNPLIGKSQTVPLDSANAFVDHSISFNITHDNGNDFFRLDSIDYHVLGVFENSAPESMQINIDCFTSMKSSEPLNGSMYVDGIGLDDLRNALEKILPKEVADSIALTPMKRSLTDRFQLLLRDQFATMIVLMLTLLLVMISSVALSLSWIDSRRSELFARFLAGATDQQLKYQLVRDYCLLVLASSIPGLLAALLIIQSGLLDQIIRNFNLLSSAIALLLISVLGWLTIIITLSNRRKDKIGGY